MTKRLLRSGFHCAHALSTSPLQWLCGCLSVSWQRPRPTWSVVGAPVAGRNDEYEIGVPTLMLNMIAIRTRIDKSKKKISDSTFDVTEAVSFGDSVFSKVVIC